MEGKYLFICAQIYRWFRNSFLLLKVNSRKVRFQFPPDIGKSSSKIFAQKYIDTHIPLYDWIERSNPEMYVLVFIFVCRLEPLDVTKMLFRFFQLSDWQLE